MQTTNNLENSKGDLMRLMQQVHDQAVRSVDLLAPTGQAQFSTTEGKSLITLEANKGLPTIQLAPNQVALNQIATKAGLDTRTANRLRTEYSTEYDGLINAIWQKEESVRMLRTFMDEGETTGVCRAFVSDKFKTFDNHHMLNAALPQLMESDAQWKVVNASITDKRLYLRLKSDAITGAGSHVNDLMALGIGLSNSETGFSSVNIYQIAWTLACLNGMQTENRHRSSHITGSRGDENVWGMLTDEAKDADNHALELKVRDMVTGFASRDSFDKILHKFQSAAADVATASPVEVVENLGKVMKLTKDGTSKVLEGLMATMGQAGYSGQPISRATMVNAVTAVAHDVDADNVDEWQKLGGKVLDLPRRDWERVAEAA